ncbi:MAG: DUF3034 family protein [Rhodospirillaceae bacterium]|nr:DUF3034 family protein [Rhodospirillaceae bacterium]
MCTKLAVVMGLAVAAAGPALAQLAAPPVTTDALYGGKLLATGGVSQLEGAGGGGLTPWALISGYGTDNQIGGNAHFTHIKSQDFHLNTYGAAMGLYDRFEFSVARQEFDTENVGAALGLGRGFTITQDVIGVKVKIAGDAVLDQDRLLPQFAIGAQYKHNNRGALLRTLGAGGNDGVDFYVSATKLLLAESLLLNGTLRFTKANQTGILGFTGDYKPMLEGSAAVLLNRHWVLGAEYRMKTNRIAAVAREDDWYDAFVAWFPNKHISVTVAYVRLGNVVIRDNQNAAYLSLQVGF